MSDAGAGDVIPVSIITGFLGSGKTTLIDKLLRQPAMSDSAVIINEFGEIGLDHHLVQAVEGDVVVMESGCLCCTIRSSLTETLRDLHGRRGQGAVSRFRRLLIETTGLADPTPIIHTLMEDQFVRHHFNLSCVITTVDALHGSGQLDEHIESVKQAAVADRLLLTKTDIASPDATEELRGRLHRLNPGAPIILTQHGEVDPRLLFEGGLYDLASKTPDVRQWLRAEEIARASDHDHAHHHDGVNRHDNRIQAHCLVFDEPLDWRYFSPNLASFVSRNAEKLLRVKGILNIEGEPAPVVVHGVQHQFHRMRLPKWPDDDRRSKLVLITRDLDRDFVRDWLQSRSLSG
jgi:G3E family GTPase